jgi:peptidylprolyl isomerase
MPRMRKLLLIIGACLALLVAGCGDDDSTTASSPSAASTEEAADAKETDSAKQETKPTVTVPNGPPPKSLVTKDLVVGDVDLVAEAGDVVKVHYVGVNYKNGKEFDASWGRGEPIAFTLGNGEVIPGWDEGLEGMKVGGRRELIIPPDLAYGAKGFPPAIPPNETLIFVVDLVATE